MIELVALPYSPWSEKARWALDHHAVAYEEKVYQPLVGEPWMRLRQRKSRGAVSVPALFDGAERCTDSWSIALYAERTGKGAPLFPEGLAPAIEELDALGERGLRAGRARALDRVLRSDGALTEMLPRALRGKLGAVGVAVAAFGVKRTLRKYGSHELALPEHEAQLVAVLDEVRGRLRAGRNDGATLRYLLGRFTYADIAVAQVLQFVAPLAESYRCVRIGRASRAAFTDAELSVSYADVVEWRDALYARHRASESGAGRREEAVQPAMS
jgi:glutathione S-transferase